MPREKFTFEFVGEDLIDPYFNIDQSYYNDNRIFVDVPGNLPTVAMDEAERYVASEDSVYKFSLVTNKWHKIHDYQGVNRRGTSLFGC